MVLTARETEIRGYLCLGWTNKEIAIKLQVSPRTVEDHRASILRKYEARNTIEMLRAVYGLDEVDEVTSASQSTPAKGS